MLPMTKQLVLVLENVDSLYLQKKFTIRDHRRRFLAEEAINNGRL
jgi:hypothetical protein